ncbi:MAG TPA: primosomal protein N', partial [Bacillota bacterium]|nr:primosomal protein N' [Bacillota bacterium]
DMTPKYDTLEIAIKRSAYYGGPVILGSATPSVVSYYRSEKGLYRRLVLNERYNKTPLPGVNVADMRLELKEGNKSVISRALYKDMDETLKAGMKVILFLNRRGYSTFISCRECGHVMQCRECGISLTYHKEKDRIKCHYCGYEEAVPSVCPSCGSRYIRYFGTGTEKVEEEVKSLFPGHKTARLDTDTARKKGSMEKILDDFSKGDTDILTGTQIVAKGLDYPNVALVGIISADVSLNIPDFRSAEKAFQLMIQASGRAGRGTEAGKVIIQTYTPENYAVCAAAAQDYRKFYDTEIKLREYMGYPPFCDLILLVFDSKIRGEAEKGALYWKAGFIALTGKCHEENILPIQQIPSNISKEGWKCNMLIKCPLGNRKIYMGALEEIKNRLKNDKNKKYNVAVDVNPYSLWRS